MISSFQQLINSFTNFHTSPFGEHMQPYSSNDLHAGKVEENKKANMKDESTKTSPPMYFYKNKLHNQNYNTELDKKKLDQRNNQNAFVCSKCTRTDVTLNSSRESVQNASYRSNFNPCNEDECNSYITEVTENEYTDIAEPEEVSINRINIPAKTNCYIKESKFLTDSCQRSIQARTKYEKSKSFAISYNKDELNERSLYKSVGNHNSDVLQDVIRVEDKISKDSHNMNKLNNYNHIRIASFSTVNFKPRKSRSLSPSLFSCYLERATHSEPLTPRGSEINKKSSPVNVTFLSTDAHDSNNSMTSRYDRFDLPISSPLMRFSSLLYKELNEIMELDEESDTSYVEPVPRRKNYKNRKYLNREDSDDKSVDRGDCEPERVFKIRSKSQILNKSKDTLSGFMDDEYGCEVGNEDIDMDMRSSIIERLSNGYNYSTNINHIEAKNSRRNNRLDWDDCHNGAKTSRETGCCRLLSEPQHRVQTEPPEHISTEPTANEEQVMVKPNIKQEKKKNIFANEIRRILKNSESMS